MSTKQPRYKMSLVTSSEAETVYFEKLRLQVAPEGLLITAKSEVFGKYFASIAKPTPTGKPSTYKGRGIWAGGSYFVLTQRFPTVPGYVSNTDYPLFADGQPNLLWLTHENLAKGCSLLLPQPLSINDLEDYVSSSATFIQNFYRSVLRPATVEMTFSVIEPD